MAAPAVLPKYLYKILDSEPPLPMPAVFPPSELDKADGFIHLSTASQVPSTAARFFAARPALWLLKIRYAAIAGAVTWEHPPGGGGDGDGFPHVYGASIGAAETAAVAAFARGPAGCGAEVFAASGWLEW